MTASREKRQAAFRRGIVSEGLAANWLRLKGYRILASRFRTKHGEIDLIARRGATVAFVEVKARRTRDAALEAVDRRSQQRIVNAARSWISQNPTDETATYRFDVIAIVPWSRPYHLENAFAAD